MVAHESTFKAWDGFRKRGVPCELFDRHRVDERPLPLARDMLIAGATLHHPNICPVFEVGKADPRPDLTMAPIEGATLAARLRRTGPLIPEARAPRVGRAGGLPASQARQAVG